MKKQKPMGLFLNGSLKQSGITFFIRGGQMVARSAYSRQPQRRTRGQFVARQQLAHSCRLWHILKRAGDPLFDNAPTAYARFRSLMRRTPVVFIPGRGPMADATLLLPGMPVSDGVLPVVEQWLGEVDGTPALLTSLTGDSLRRSDILRLYTLRQGTGSCSPTLHISAVDLKAGDFQTVDGRLALVGDEYGDDLSGWAVVHIRDGRCSSQAAVTRCTYYRPFTTESALLAAAESYGGLTEDVHP